MVRGRSGETECGRRLSARSKNQLVEAGGGVVESVAGSLPGMI